MTHCDTCKKTRNIASILRAFTSYHERVKPREHDIRSLDAMTVAGLPSSVFYAVACIHHQGEDRQEEKSASSSPHPR